MKKNVLVSATVVLMLVLSVPLAFVLGAFYQGTPSPSLSPVFGILVDFDDKSVGTPVLWDDYVGVGVASITETEGLGTFARYPSTQSLPCYVGTGLGGERGDSVDPDMGWDGTILIELCWPTDKIGIGVANERGLGEVVTIYDCDFNVLETAVVPVGLNVYVYFERANFEIMYLEITGDFFAIDDLQFNPCPPHMIPEIPLGTIMATAAMMIALVCYVAVPRTLVTLRRRY